MAEPIRNADPGKVTSVQFAHFGVLNDGAQSKASTLTAVVINILLAFVIIVIGAATKKISDNRQKLTELTAPIPIKKIEPLKPKVVPPKPPPPKLPEVPKIVIQAPKIVVPEKLPDIPKPQVVKMDTPKPIVMPAPPKTVVAMAAPKVVNLAAPPTPPALANNSQHPSAVALGSPNNPIAASSAQVSNVNLGNKGMAGMPSSNVGQGRPTAVNLAGNGSPNGSNKGTGVQAVQGVKLGVTGGTGPLNGTGKVAGPVNLGQVQQPAMPRPVAASAPPQRSTPTVISKPKPVYTAEATQLHIEGTVTVRIRVLPDGSTQVLGVSSGLGHGLDEAAVKAAQGMRFKPALDASGNPVAWEGVATVQFQLAG